MISKMTARLLAEAFGLEAVLRKAEADGFKVNRPLKESEIAEKKAEAFRYLERDIAGNVYGNSTDAIKIEIDKTTVMVYAPPGWLGMHKFVNHKTVEIRFDPAPVSSERKSASAETKIEATADGVPRRKGEDEFRLVPGGKLRLTDPIEDLQKETAELRGLLKRAFEDCAQTNKAATEVMASMGNFEEALTKIRQETIDRHEGFLRAVVDDGVRRLEMLKEISKLTDDGPMIPRLGDTVVIVNADNKAAATIVSFGNKGSIDVTDSRGVRYYDVPPLMEWNGEVNGLWYWRWPNDSDEMPGDDIEAFAREMEKVSGLAPEEVDDEDDLKCAPEGEVAMETGPGYFITKPHQTVAPEPKTTIDGVPIGAFILINTPDDFDPKWAKAAIEQNSIEALSGAFNWTASPQGFHYWEKISDEIQRGEKMRPEARSMIEAWLIKSQLVEDGLI